MIILPDKNIPRAKFLMPMQDKYWRVPSHAIPYDEFGNLTEQTRFRIRAKTHDGVVLWRGFFDDRADFDAFLWAIQIGSLPQERSLWELPTPMWPGLDPGLVYDFATVTFLTSTSTTSYSSPVDWNNADNLIEVIGAGGSGGCAQNGYTSSDNTYSKATGGGGGGYSNVFNYRFATPGTSAISYRAGTGGTTLSGSPSTGNYYDIANGSVGSDSWFGGAVFPASPDRGAGAKGGGGGNATLTMGATLTGGTGGSSANGYTSGGTKYSGGNGGSINSPSYYSATGGGAANITGNGGNGPAPTASRQACYGGNSVGDAIGGAGATGVNYVDPTFGRNYVIAQGANARDGVNACQGTYWDSTHGAGGGGGAVCFSTNDTAYGEPGRGGLYGAGGGGGCTYGNRTNNYIEGSVGQRGLIVVTYTPSTGTFKNSGFNMPMLGM